MSGSAKVATGTIVRAAIHPAIGIARVGNSVDGVLPGPEVTHPAPPPPGSYRDSTGALNRQSCRFRIYGLDAKDCVVAELTSADADIQWTVHLVNTKAAWYQFQLALDIPEAASAPPSLRRNASVQDRSTLAIDPGPRTIAGAAGASVVAFDTGTFGGQAVYLGELRTDDQGRLIVLGGRGTSRSVQGRRATTFANNDGWCDDTSDGPVTAAVSIEGRSIPVDPAWVVVTPPSYAPMQKSVRTMWDLQRDLFISTGALPEPLTVSFDEDIRPIFERLAEHQWVNAGFAAAFGWNGLFNFADTASLVRLSDPSPHHTEARRLISNHFRVLDQSGTSPTVWPWLYGDAMNIPAPDTPRQYAGLTNTQLAALSRWAAGDFETDYEPTREPPRSIDEVPLADQPAMLDRAALDFCIADAFHPGCEMTWPVRHASMYAAPFRFAVADLTTTEPDYGDQLTPAIALATPGPLGPLWPGGITRWMAVPWPTDTASCRGGYTRAYDPYLPTFWPARAPNQVMAAAEYDVVVDPSSSLADRQAAFVRRIPWVRPLGATAYKVQINSFLSDISQMGVVEVRPGPTDGADFPATMQVENLHPKVAAAVEGLTDRGASAEIDLSGIEKVRRFPHGLA